jgi:hypothetical protein
MRKVTDYKLLGSLARVFGLAVTGALAFAALSSSTPSKTAAVERPKGVTLRQIDGGPRYFAHLDAKSAWMDGTMLLGAWEEEPLNPREVGYDRRMGNNIYWNVAGNPQERSCGGPCLVDYNIMRARGMHLCSPNPPDRHTGSETVCAMVGDELDMSTGPNPSAAIRAFDNPPVQGVVSYQGYGKGILFWETNAQARQFMKYTDVLAADSYWMTDSGLDVGSQGGCALLPRHPACTAGRGLTTAERELPANYAYNVTRLAQLEALNGESKPIVVDIETGCPGSDGSCITPAAFTVAAWHAIIAGARGIIWFQHNFSGPCVDYNTFYDGSDHRSYLYDCHISKHETIHQLVAAVSSFNHQVTRLNAVLLSPFAQHYVNTGDADVSVMAKDDKGQFFIFAGSGRPGVVPHNNLLVHFRIAGSYTGPVTVIGERRVLRAVNGIFTDKFLNEYSVHIYQIGPTSGAAGVRG